MPELVETPSRVAAVGTPPKTIDEFVGRASSGDSGSEHRPDALSLGLERARTEAGLRRVHGGAVHGALHVEHEGGELDVGAGQAVIVRRGEWVRYSTPGPEGAEYVAVCLPAFSLETVHRDG